MLDMSSRAACNEDLAMFRDSVRKLFNRMLVPKRSAVCPALLKLTRQSRVLPANLPAP